MLAEHIKSTIRDIPDFPQKGVIFRDITPILKDSRLCNSIILHIRNRYKDNPPEAIAAMESRGFLFGFLLAHTLQVPFIPIRKKGKLPFHKFSQSYDLEYGKAEVEIHTDALIPGQKVMIHDDLLATGGTAKAAAQLIRKLEGKIHSFNFIVELEFLNGRDILNPYKADVFSLVHYK